ncbi:MAG TPA: bifunctional hydroxymethylpyrimidine kinase/phosphomethylpyrimidine kinase [Solirubrobacteraceae bacterium]|jgi:hydroxymethylpyrimidine/phosphomethylpyrimidine kinase|nr:bifunctional hydroxymethylpyrimidine kinase/phosphomethylpyrimidine kinase [Solirubrobacteraceae bacterium]
MSAQPSSRPVAAETPVALTIAGSDSGGGAGIQADLKAFARCGVHGTSAITAITAQSTIGVAAVHPLPSEMILAQVRAVAEDMTIAAVKVGMLADVEVVGAVARALSLLPEQTPVVVDPVMVAESGARLLAEGAEQALAREILPRATVVTPNLPEARVLAGSPAVGSSDDADPAEAEALARAVLSLGAGAVVLTGGHRTRAVDLFIDSPAGVAVEIEGPRYPDGAAHGSGCTHSAALAAQLALGRSPLEAARAARALASAAIRDGLRGIGRGAGPVDVLGLRRMREQPF